MKQVKILLTLFLTIGFFFPSCIVSDDDDCNCGGSRFFDVEGLEILSFKDDSRSSINLPGETISLATYGGLYIDYLARYHAQLTPKRDWSFSLMNTAYACSCIVGFDGSKEEELVSFSITTLNDFDNDHLAGSDIVDLFDVRGTFFSEENESLSDYLANMTGKLMQEDMLLMPTKVPELNAEVKVRVRMELSTGEVYEADSVPFTLVP